MLQSVGPQRVGHDKQLNNNKVVFDTVAERLLIVQIMLYFRGRVYHESGKHKLYARHAAR